ncbi:MAG: hypothetical protein PVJ92_02890 [Candidatus Dependentiae bacterium]
MKKFALMMCLVSCLAVTAGCWNPFASFFGNKAETEEVKPS